MTPLQFVAPFAFAAAMLALAAELPSERPASEYHFIRLEYTDLFTQRRFNRGWWRQDWPEADLHFTQGVKRLTRIDIGEPRHLPLTDDRVFEHPWIYATQAGYWNLSDAEVKRLREYLLRGGFLIVDDFYGPEEWAVFRDTIARVLPGKAILGIEERDSAMHVLYDIRERVFIPGLRHLRPNGVQHPPWPPQWRAMYDDRGRMVVAIHYNQDVGDAWEHADLPQYPEVMTSLAYRFGINYIVYAMTH